MTVENAVRSRLNGFAGLTSLVASRIHPLTLPQNVTYPAVSYSKVSVERVRAMGADPGLALARFQVSCWATTYAAVRDVGEQVRAALQRWRGTVEGVVIQESFFENEVDLFEPAVGEPTRGIYHRALDFTVIHEE